MKIRRLIAVLLLTFGLSLAVAAPTFAKNDLDFSKIESVQSGTGTETAITDTLDKWVLNLRIVGVILAILAIVLGAIIFSMSLGNSQRRGLGISAMLCAAISIVIIIKAPQLAGYFINQT
ncbi:MULTISPECIES: hypothetical protein [Cohnella]|uniref:TrbC/VIRB2 family protein n=1 Tax=Cohnella phaseoli TaxID=456490 RepID=A0A3D9JPR1_9BACL|nr:MULTISPECIES: hypothetical protein [Cohnella]RED76022.1 hypothetical protein DFP98_11382 [Cohnella phaseoli]